jgi:conjugative relaxase-like TrwC/TraI family protein
MVRLDKPCHVLRGAVEYFREHLRVGDYLTEEGGVAMTWSGRGAASLGLEGMCDLDTFSRLCEGRHPWSGERLGVRQKHGRRLCYFGQISAPKDVSIAYLVGGDHRIAEWWNEAVRETLDEIEVCVATRVRVDGANRDRSTQNMVAAVVTHDTSRSLDPQLHTHVCLMNLTYDQSEQRWKSVQPSGFFRHPGYLREVCYNRLAARMIEGGYKIEPSRKVGFQIAGLPVELRSTFSKRRRTIERLAKEAGVSSQAELQAITARSRPEKTKSTAAELRDGWFREAGETLVSLQELVASAQPKSEQIIPDDPEAVMVSAEAKVFERRSVADRRLLLREALALGRGRVELADLKTIISDREQRGLLRVHRDLVGSPAALQCEREFLSWAESEIDTCRPLGVAEDCSRLGGAARVVEGILGSSSRLVILQGDAGTGKTTCLRSIVAGIEAGGSHVFGCAPTSGAADVLRAELTPEADTLQQLLVNPSLQKLVRGRVVVVDEAGLMSSRQMRDLCRMAEENQNRLLLVGDTKQHSSVEAGDALRCLQQYAQVPVFKLTKIRRQRDPAYREAVALLASGKAQAGFDAFARLGAVAEVSSSAELMERAATDYVETLSSGKRCLAISPVWSEIREFGRAVRAKLKAAGRIFGSEVKVRTFQSLQWTNEEKRRIGSYHCGDVICFRRATHEFAAGEFATVKRTDGDRLLLVTENGIERLFVPRATEQFDVGLTREIPIAAGDRLLVRANHRPARLRNGDLVEVVDVESKGRIRLADGREIPSGFRDFTHGYATTSHAAQGKTVDRGLLIMADAGISSANLKQAYVSNSRFVESQMIYTTDRKAAREAMARPGERILAVEMVSSTGDLSTARQAFLADSYTQGFSSGADVLRGWKEVTPNHGPALATGTTG